MTTNQPIEWDTEEVLAFVHDVRPWRDLDETERTEWVRRVKHIRDNVTTDGKTWTNERLAGLFGIAHDTLRHRFSRLGTVSGGPARSLLSKRGADAGRLLRDPEAAAAVIASLRPEERSALRNVITDVQLAEIESAITNDADDFEPTSMRAAQRALGHASAPKTIYESGALFLFREAFGLLNTADMVFKTAGFRLSDLEETATSIREFIIMTERMEDMAKRFREALFMANAELETR